MSAITMDEFGPKLLRLMLELPIANLPHEVLVIRNDGTWNVEPANPDTWFPIEKYMEDIELQRTLLKEAPGEPAYAQFYYMAEPGVTHEAEQNAMVQYFLSRHESPGESN